ncbi:major facilitator superfamily MFS-1 [Auriculariales sp. MPI-PUGE-AT-0066]|nr:major facilitator superfamily MFS-1 [Auriculariales sp. MPI-PUGE-AT-0066]
MPLLAGRNARARPGLPRDSPSPPNEQPHESAPEIPRRARIPKPLQSKSAGDTTPLPVLPLAVLSITMLGEFLSANVSTPFILKMVQGFGVVNVGSWGGNLVASFFITQFFTSLFWATIAEKHGARLVLCVSLLGSALTCALFGTATSLSQAFAIRLMQGVFAGAIGVARGSVSRITDQSNEGRAYAIIGFSWGFGGVVGAIIGGSLESPVDKWPDTFTRYPLLVKYPYLLPCATASSITLIGAVLSMFLARDGGVRGGAIRLRLPEKLLGVRGRSGSAEDSQMRPNALVRLKTLFRKSSNGPTAVVAPVETEEAPISGPVVPSKADGAAYGYTSSRLPAVSEETDSRQLVAEALRRRRGARQQEDAPPAPHLNFSQRMLMANEAQVMSLTDLPRLLRRGSSSASALPGIFTHTGVRSRAPLEGDDEILPLRREPSSDSTTTQATLAGGQGQSMMQQLPLFIIFQYGLLALHSTTHDQIFLSYLSSSYKVGGLGLQPAGYAQLIALMSFAQISYQFYLYPNIGPPRGRFSHLNMFRIGSALYIPAYLSVIMYRTIFVSDKTEGGVMVMGALALSTAVRYCGSTFAYTSIVILLNYVSPPHVVGMANGLAQSIVSLARFFGPIIGGYLWSSSVADNPGGYPFGFLVCSGVCTVAIVLSFFVR